MAPGKRKHNKAISYILRIAVAAGALYLAFRGENLSQVAKGLSEIRLWVFALAMLVYIGGQLVFVVRWSLLLKVQSIHIGFAPAVRLHMLGLFYNNCLPGAIAGDLPRAWYVTHHTDKKVEAALSVFVDRLVGLTGIVVMAFCSYWFIPAGGAGEEVKVSFKMNPFAALASHKWVILGVCAGVAVVVLAIAATGWGRKRLRRVFELVSTRGGRLLGKMRDAMRVYLSKAWAIGVALLLTFCCQGLHVVAMWLVGREIGVEAGIKYYFIFFPISWLLGAVPVSIGGLGIMEGWLKVMFQRVGDVSGGQALVLGLCQRMILLFASLPGVVIHLLGGHLPRDISEEDEA